MPPLRQFVRFLSMALATLSLTNLCAQLQSVNYSPTEEIFPNPERGFYAHREVQAERATLSLSDLRAQRSRNRTLILRMYYLKLFRDKDLSDKQLELIQNDFNIMRQAGVKCVLRFAYSQDIGQPDAPLDIILRHLDQLQPVLQANADVIAVMQAGFIGAWGEWHSSTNNLDNIISRRTILQKILEVLPAERMVQVRTPLFKQQIFSTTQPLTSEQAFNGTGIARTGHHNDCFLASWDDYGTYQDTTREKAYLNFDTRFVPMGGETCNPSKYSGCGNALHELARLRWSYLNRNYHATVLNGFINGGCMEEIERRLGYRFALIQSELSTAVRPGAGFHIKLTLTNEGWASPFNPREVEILLRNNADSSIYFAKLPEDPRFWLSGDTVVVEATIGVPTAMPQGQYSVLLNMPDTARSIHARPEYAIQLANDNVWEPATGYNNLLASVSVTDSASGEPYSGPLVFRPMDTSTSVGESRSSQPVSPKLLGIFPNPFNPATTIKYELPRREFVSLKVFNLSGQQVVTLRNGHQEAGLHTATFNGGELTSGVYLCKLQTNTFTATRTMILLK